MLTLKRVAVTGGLASGKSTVCHLLRKHGAYVISADEIVHRLLFPQTNIGKQVINLLGSEIIQNQTLDRQKIAQKVFSDPHLLQSLEAILHPAVFEEINKQYGEVVKQRNATLFVTEVPLLFETGYDKFVDKTIAVVADSRICKQRFVASTGFPPEEYDKRAKRQWSMAEKAAKADYVIVNNGTELELQQQVNQIFDQLIL